MPSSEQLKKQLLELGIITLITVIVWIAYGVYTALMQPSQTQVSKAELKPIPKNLNLEQLGLLKERTVIDDETLEIFMSENQSLFPVINEAPASPSSFLIPPPPIFQTESLEASPSSNE